jgi:hypothetical protein
MNLTTVTTSLKKAWRSVFKPNFSLPTQTGISQDGVRYQETVLVGEDQRLLFRMRIYETGSLQIFTAGSIRVESLDQTQMNGSLIHLNSDHSAGSARDDLAQLRDNPVDERIKELHDRHNEALERLDYKHQGCCH